MSLINDVCTLQEIDDEVAGLEAAIADIDVRLAHSETLAAAEAAFAEADARFQDLRRAQRALETDVAALDAKITPEEKRLYDGSVRNPKELTAIQHELELLKAQRGQLEDRLLAVMEEFEAADAARRAAEAALAAARREREQEVAALETRRRQLAASLAASVARRSEQAARIHPASLRLYDDIRRRRGSAVARIRGGTCSGCRVAIPESVRRKAFDPATLAQCPNCERILFIG
jgi:predicted  nucleic acid-binding Zn-ribbon protein